MNKLARSFYKRDTTEVAKDLLGKEIVFVQKGSLRIAQITEVEAYLGTEDKASHTYEGRRTQRTETMYLPGGHAYIYLIYGMYSLLNIVTGNEDTPTGVMIRGAKPIEGLDDMAFARTGKSYGALTSEQIRNLMNGPGKFSQAMGLTTAFDGIDLLGDVLYLRDTGYRPEKIGAGKRIGIDYAEEHADWLLRYYIEK